MTSLLSTKVIQELMGHSDIAITLRLYAHLLPSRQQDAVEKWEKGFRDDEDEER